MKKILLILFACFLFTGCSLIPSTSSGTTKIKTSFGSYRIPGTWEKNNSHSTANKYFFINKNDRNVKTPNNISVEMGTNRYSKDDHIKFRQAIMSQISMQMKGQKATINGSGSTTKQGYIVYTFIIESDNGLNYTIQHYIVGDYKYVLVHETIWDGNREDADNAAKKIVNTFRWKD